MRDQFAAYGGAIADTSVLFVSKLSIEKNIKKEYGLNKELLPVKNCRSIGKKDLKYNDATPNVEVDSQTFNAAVDLADLEN